MQGEDGMLEAQDAEAFAPLGSISLTHPALLLPGACNPVMDLVVLCSSTALAPAPSSKGKGREDEGQKIALWRMSGNKVWEVGYDGVLASLAWSPDGLYLSILTYSRPFTLEERQSITFRLAHLSLHDGTTVHSSELGVEAMTGQGTWEAMQNVQRFWEMEWRMAQESWPKPENGTARMMVDMLPKPDPVEPPKPSNPLLLQLMANMNKNKPKAPSKHSSLADFPSLLPTHSQTNPQFLSIAPPRPTSSRELLSGTYTVGDVPNDQTLVMAGISHRLSGYFDVVLRGLENAETAYKEGGKQTMIWREELETCGEQQGTSVKDVHAELFRFLMTGRSSVAVNEWLGNRLTGRVLQKWESTLEQSYADIHKVLVESVQPAIERVILLIDEIGGLSRIPGWHIDAAAISGGLDRARGLVILTERIRRLAKDQAAAATEWFRWLQYEIARTSASDQSQEHLPAATYDVKLVWSFMKSGFVDPPLFKHFPSSFEDATLPPSAYERLGTTRRNLNDTLRQTLDKLSGARPDSPSIHPAQTPRQDEPDDSMDSLAAPVSVDESSTRHSRESSTSSQGTVERKRIEPEDPREPTAEPLVWAKELVKVSEGLFRYTSAGGSRQVRVNNLDPAGETLFATRSVEGDAWVAYASTPSAAGQLVVIAFLPGKEAANATFTSFSVEQGAQCAALDFFDDEELVLVTQKDDNLSLCTVRYADYPEQLVAVPPELAADWTMDDLTKHIINPAVESDHTTTSSALPVSRGRMLPFSPVAMNQRPRLAVNGRRGRRVACVCSGDGMEVEVFDMEDGEVDEDEDGGEAAEADEEMQEA